MSSEGSITVWLKLLPAGDPEAAQQLWQRYFHRMVGLARQRLQGAPHAAHSAEDVALSAFASFCKAAAAGRFPRLDDRDCLWRVLMKLTAHKAAHLLRDQGRQKRGGGKAAVGGPEGAVLLEQVLDGGPTPDEAALVAEQFERLLQALEDKVLQDVAVWRMEGCTVKEISERLGCNRRSVTLMLKAIRAVWEKDPGP
jgi:RNA polymerase sigma factor (sigma-70 family)